MLYLNLIGQIDFYLIPFSVLFWFVFLNRIGHSYKKQRMLWKKIKSPSYSITWPDIISSGNTLKFLDHKHDKDDGNFSGSGKKISITLTTVWRCAPCQQMRRIQITQWSGSWACNLLAKIEFIRCGWLRWREWGCVGLAAPRQIVWPLREQTQVRKYPPAVTAIKISALLPGAMLSSNSGERLDRPQPGLT